MSISTADNSFLQENLESQNPDCDKNEVKSYGQFSASYLPQYVTVSMAVAISLSYVFAIALGQETPIPQATISQTAQDFPSYLFLRLGMIPIIPLIYVIFICGYWYWNKIFEMYNVDRKCSTKFILIVGFITLVVYSITMATLCPDTNFNIHDPCALAMFGLFYFLFLLILIEYYHIVKLSGYKYISEKSYKIKIAYFVCFSLVLLYAGYSYYQVKQMNNHVILCEWIGVIFIILDFWTFTWDFENLQLSLLSVVNNEKVVINPTIVVCIQEQSAAPLTVQLQELK